MLQFHLSIYLGFKELSQVINIKKSLLSVAILTSLTACTSAKKVQVNQPIVQPNNISASLNQEKYLKRLVAIGRFSDETKRGNSFLLDNNNNRIGKQATDILSARLTDTGKFIMLERADIELINQEADAEQNVGSDFILLGSVSEYGRTTTSEVGVFSRNKIQKANVTVNVRLVNTKTSQIVYSEEASGEATLEANHVLGVGQKSGYDSSLDDKALSAAISKLTSNIVENLLDSPWQSYILNSENGALFIAGGSTQGLKVGDVFDILETGKKIKNPQTGMYIELPGKKVASIKIESLVGSNQDQLSLAMITSGNINHSALTKYVVREHKGTL